MFSTFTVQPLLRGVHLDDASVAASESSAPPTRSFLDRSSTVSPSGTNSPIPKSTGIFNRNTRPVIESLDSFENHLYLGTSDGHLLHYVIEEQISSQSDLPRSRLVRRKALGFGKKVVEKIMVISVLRIAILLCDSTLTFYSLPDFQPFAPQILPPIKGVTAFCEDSSQSGHVAEDGSVRLCVTKRRIIQFYSLWPDAISDPKELSLPNGALVVTRWKNFICVADANDFKLIDSRVGRMIPVLPVVQSSNSGSNAQVLKPVCIAITENEFLLASATSSGQTAIGIFCSGAGDPVRGTLQWSSYPRALGIEFPYVAALLRGNIIEVHNILDQKLIQTLRFDSTLEIRTLVQGPGLAVWMSSLARVLALQSWHPSATEGQSQQEVNRIATVLARVLFAGKDTVSALITTPLVLHADGLLQKGHVEEALLLSEKATATISEENRHRERLQFELDFIHQKSGLIYLEETLFDDAFGLFLRGKIDPRAIISMFPDVLQQEDIIGDVKLFRGVRELLSQRGTLQDISDQGTEFGDMLLTNAKDVFLQYLLKCKREYRSAKGRPGPIVEAIDTALLGLWVDSGDDKNLLRLLSGTNACIQDLAEAKLKSTGKHYALSIWYRSHKKQRAALSIWKSLLQGELKDSSSAVRLQDMATLVLTLQDMSLIEEYGWWIVGQDETIGLKIFMPGDAKRAAMFDPDRVLASCKAKVSQDGLMAYLEYLVNQRKSETPEHHTMLSQLYVDSIVSAISNPASAAKHQELVNAFREKQGHKLISSGDFKTLDSAGIMDTFLSHLQANSKTNPTSSYRAKLAQLVQSSPVLDAEGILRKVKNISILQYEVALLLARTGKFEECIAILVKDVKDFQGVEILCLNGGSLRNRSKGAKAAATSEGTHSKVATAELHKRRKLFMVLLQEYLRLSEDDGGMNLTLRLLNSQSSYLDISEVVQFLPEYWSVEALQEYLLRSLRRSHHDFKEIQVVKGLSLGENLRVSEELFQLYESQGPVVITADDVCAVCGDAVADTVFMRTVDMRIIHLHCGSTTAAENPSTRIRMGHVKLANYSLAYKRIKNAAFSDGGTSSTVLFFVAADVDSICAFRMWAMLLKSDCISYVVVPVAGMEDVRDEAKIMSGSIRSVLMLNCGGLFNLEDYIELTDDVTIYVLDSHRPVNLRNAFWNNEIIVFHESDLDKDLAQEKEAIIFTEEDESDMEDDLEEDQDDDDRNDRDDDDHRRIRRRTGNGSEVAPRQVNRQWKESRAIIVDYMSRGSTIGTSISNQTYMMATQLDRTTLDILWLAIVGLSSQYLSEQISHRDYLAIAQVYKDESERLARTGLLIEDLGSGTRNNNVDDGSIRCTEEYRFMMVRHWSLYESMYNSNYVASRLGIWREPGRQRLLALLAKMGFSLEECNQVFAHMSIDLKKILKERVELVAPEYGLHEVLYTSFTRSYGYRGLMSASDVVCSVTSLLEASPAALVAMKYSPEWTAEDSRSKGVLGDVANGQDGDDGSSSWWHSNFFRACDSLDGVGGEGDQLRHGLKLCMQIQKAVIRQGIAIIEKQVIITLSTCRVATLKDGPDLPVFWDPLSLSKLAQFLVYAIREYGSSKSGHRPIPLVVAVLKEETQTFVVTGINGSPVIGEVNPNKFGNVFERISYNEKIPVKYLGFDKSVIEIDRDDLETFMGSIGRYMRS
ncbi:hypothetical protein BGX33_007985 [Mortierella sp. NVP41]|nr:hypothetical protein BGX33_007985 [Mortierella sp. NVP41]